MTHKQILRLFTSMLLVGFIIGVIGSITPADSINPNQTVAGQITVCFTPNKVCQQQLVARIHSAKKRILVQAYSFTDPDVSTALVNMHESGVDVRIILDKSNKGAPYTRRGQVVAAGIPTRIDSPPGIAHSKIILIDDELVITGSYNFSRGAYKSNTENILAIQSAPLLLGYVVNFNNRWKISTPAS